MYIKVYKTGSFVVHDIAVVCPLWDEMCSNVQCDVIIRISKETFCAFCWFSVVNFFINNAWI